MCRSRRELSNEYLLAKFGFDTAENEPCEVRKFELSEIVNLNFELSKLLFAAQDTILYPRLLHPSHLGLVVRIVVFVTRTHITTRSTVMPVLRDIPVPQHAMRTVMPVRDLGERGGTLGGSFSGVSKPMFASTCSSCS